MVVASRIHVRGALERDLNRRDALQDQRYDDYIDIAFNDSQNLRREFGMPPLEGARLHEDLILEVLAGHEKEREETVAWKGFLIAKGGLPRWTEAGDTYSEHIPLQERYSIMEELRRHFDAGTEPTSRSPRPHDWDSWDAEKQAKYLLEMSLSEWERRSETDRSFRHPIPHSHFFYYGFPGPETIDENPNITPASNRNSLQITSPDWAIAVGSNHGYDGAAEDPDIEPDDEDAPETNEPTSSDDDHHEDEEEEDDDDDGDDGDDGDDDGYGSDECSEIPKQNIRHGCCNDN
jgi:hypothetical protein